MKPKMSYREEYLPINRKKEYLLHAPCEKKDAPVVLFLHGCPGLGGSAYAHGFLEQLRSFCTVVCWDQLGAGKTLTANPKIFPTMERQLRDLFVVISCLKLVYGKQKVVLLCHSTGTVLGALYAQQHPEDVACYIGAGQLTEAVTHPVKTGALGLETGRMIKTVLKSPVFQWSDLRSAYAGPRKNAPMWEYLQTHPLTQGGHTFGMPVHCLAGARDPVSSVEAARAWLDSLEAPEKQLHTIADAGHFMMLDQPEQYGAVLKEILAP